MDSNPRASDLDPVVLTGCGRIVLGEAPARPDREGGTGERSRSPADACLGPYLEVPKRRKFMGLQDVLAVVAAGRALDSARLSGAPLGERAGLYLAVGYIPFEKDDIETLLEGSVSDGSFSMAAFSTVGIRSLNPLLAFRCLPNMPAYHVSVNFGLEGPYFVGYPGPAQIYLALEEASAALRAGEVEIALLLGVADQRNFLVEHHAARIEPPVAPGGLEDAAGCLVLETAAGARARSAPVRGRLLEVSLAFDPHDPLETSFAPREGIERAGGPAPEPERGDGAGDLGAASLPTRLARETERGPGLVSHSLESRDGFRASSLWEIA